MQAKVCDVYGTARAVKSYELRLIEDGAEVPIAGGCVDLCPRGLERMLAGLERMLAGLERLQRPPTPRPRKAKGESDE